MNQNNYVSEVIAQMNAEREREAVTQTRNVINTIVGQQELIRRAHEVIAEARKQLNEIKYEPVSPADVLTN